MKEVRWVYNLNTVLDYHFNKRLKEVISRGESAYTLDLLNTALLDKNNQMLDICTKWLKTEKVSYRLENVADRIMNRGRLRIAYLIPHSNAAGSVKMLMEQANRLAEKGHDVVFYSHSPKPDWIECRSPYFTVDPGNDVHEVVPPCDVVIAGDWNMAVDAMKTKAPLKYHYAGGDFDMFRFHDLEEGLKRIISEAFMLPLKIIAASEPMKQKIAELFGRQSVIVPEAVDMKAYYPATRANGETKPARILLTGSDTSAFLGHAATAAALCRLKEAGYSFETKWATPAKLTTDYGRLNLDIDEHVMANDAEAGDIYRASDIYICGSSYEAIPHSPLEAMACGTAVIAADNGGIREYARDGSNCLIFEPGNVRQLAEKIALLLDNPELRKQLAAEGQAGTGKYTWRSSIRSLERELKASASALTQAVKA